jgi:hypothetical protein
MVCVQLNVVNNLLLDTITNKPKEQADERGVNVRG